MTALAAETFQLTAVGRVARGFQADLVAFDADSVKDTATFQEPIQYSVGIKHVVIRGETVVRDEQPTGARPGRVFRRVTEG
jgi:N-acyl-D-aspartate/D-glutamate deacylase